MQIACAGYGEAMSTEIVQVRDVRSDDVAVLRSRAAERSMSLSAYLRELIHRDATHEPLSEVIARIGARQPVEADGAVIRSLIDEGRS